MLGLKKIKNGFIEIVKEHPVSVISMIISMIFWSMTVDYNSDSYAQCVAIFLTLFAVVVLPCEVYRLYKRKTDENYSFKNKKNLIVNGIIIAVGTVLSFFTGVMFTYDSAVLAKKLGTDKLSLEVSSEYIYRITACFMIAAVCATLYLFMKKSGESFETYTAKAFCGLMKAELVYLVIFTGLTMILGAFSALIYELDFDIYAQVWVLLAGFVQFPCVLLGLSKTEDEISKFGKIMLNYVLTGLLAIAFAIIYVYIVKVFVQWTFPLYMVFGILTALFGFGVFIWTMAQGICEENMRKIFKYMPLLFIPCIIMEIISLGRQISIYGLTLARYAGIAAIVFEIAYFVLYIYNMKKEKNAMPVVFAIVIAVAYVSLLAPGINAYSAVIASHKGNVMKYLEGKTDAKAERKAKESYRTIIYSCGAVGEKFADKKLTEEQKNVMLELAGDKYEYESGSFYVCANRREVDSFDISGGYEKLYIADISFNCHDTMESDRPDGLYEYEVDCGGEMIGTVNLEAVVKKLIELDKEEASAEERDSVIDAPVDLIDGGKMIITYISVEYGEDEGHIENIDASGYVLQ